MAAGLGEQIEGRLTHLMVTSFGEKPWVQNRASNKRNKIEKHRRERRRGRQDPECLPEYRRFAGYEW